VSVSDPKPRPPTAACAAQVADAPAEPSDRSWRPAPRCSAREPDHHRSMPVLRAARETRCGVKPFTPRPGSYLRSQSRGRRSSQPSVAQRAASAFASCGFVVGCEMAHRRVRQRGELGQVQAATEARRPISSLGAVSPCARSSSSSLRPGCSARRTVPAREEPARRGDRGELDPCSMTSTSRTAFRLPVLRDARVRSARPAGLSFRRCRCGCSHVTLFGSKGIDGPAADGQSTSASARPGRTGALTGHHRAFAQLRSSSSMLMSRG